MSPSAKQPLNPYVGIAASIWWIMIPLVALSLIFGGQQAAIIVIALVVGMTVLGGVLWFLSYKESTKSSTK